MAEEITRAEKLEAMNTYMAWATSTNGPNASGGRYRGIAAMVYEEGEILSNDPFTEEEEAELLKLLGETRGVDTPKECYRNASQLVIHAHLFLHMNVLYGEGYGVSDLGLPLEHAVMIYNGRPVDTTWRDTGWWKGQQLGMNPTVVSPIAILERVKSNLAENVYYMVAFSPRFLMEQLTERGTYGLFEFNRTLFEKGVPPIEA